MKDEKERSRSISQHDDEKYRVVDSFPYPPFRVGGFNVGAVAAKVDATTSQQQQQQYFRDWSIRTVDADPAANLNEKRNIISSE